MRNYTCAGCGTRFTSGSDLCRRLFDFSEKQEGLVDFLHYGYLVESYRVENDEIRYVICCDHPVEALEPLVEEGKKAKA